MEVVDSETLRLHAGGRSVDLGSSGSMDELHAVVETLRSPGSFRWDLSAGVRQLLLDLEQRAWIVDADTRGDLVTAEVAYLKGTISEGRTWIVDAASTCDRAARRRLVYALGAVSRNLELDGDNLFVIVLGDVRRAWRRTSPLADYLFGEIASLAFDELQGFPDDPDREVQLHRAVRDAAGGITDLKGVRGQLSCAFGLLALGALSTRRPRPPAAVCQSGMTRSGINVLIEAERFAERLTRGLSVDALSDALADQRIATRAAQLVFLHQYSTTDRYPEAILAFLAHRLRRDIRKLGYQYFFEEYGHEVHEREAVQALGIDNDKVESFSPLPLIGAYSELISAYAATDPLTFCLLLIASEGLPNTPKAATLALSAIASTDERLATHAELDVRLDHTSMARRLLSRVPSISEAAYCLALRRFLTTLEVSQRGWISIAKYAGIDAPVAPAAFGVPAALLATVHHDALHGDAHYS